MYRETFSGDFLHNFRISTQQYQQTLWYVFGFGQKLNKNKTCRYVYQIDCTYKNRLMPLFINNN
jgi:hypothetical protein